MIRQSESAAINYDTISGIDYSDIEGLNLETNKFVSANQESKLREAICNLGHSRLNK